MRKMLFALLATLLFMGSLATLGATAQDDATPETDAKSAPTGTNPVDPTVGDAVTFYTEDGDEAGIATVTGIERGWEEFDEYQEPEAGTEYVAFTIKVESVISRGAIDLSAYDFSLQTAAGYLWSNAYASSETTEPPILEDDLSLASGDSEEFTVIFQVYEDEELAHLYWQPDSGVLLTIAQLEGE